MECEADKLKVWGGGPWIIEKQWLKIIKWSPNFSPAIQKNLCALVWVRFPKLAMKYWVEDSMMAIGRTMGNPVQEVQKDLKDEEAKGKVENIGQGGVIKKKEKLKNERRSWCQS
ncbi:hypothetical protein GIB67_013810, partial [Kingdonia uniflora]